MKRLIAAILDLFICFLCLCVLSVGVGTIQKAILDANKIYRSALYYQTEHKTVILFFLIIFLYYSAFTTTPGKKAAGMKMEEKSGGKWKILHLILRVIAVALGPFTLLYYLIAGEMPYDRLLNIKAMGKHKRRGKCSGIKLCKKMVCAVLVGAFLYKCSERFKTIFLLFLFLPLSSLVFVHDIVKIYIAAIDLPIQYIGERALREGEGGEACRFIFSAEGEKSTWGIVIKDKDQYLEECAINGYGIKELEEFDFDNGFLVCTYGRKLAFVRVLNGIHETEPPPFLGLEKEYVRGAVYYYSVPRVAVEYPLCECAGDERKAGLWTGVTGSSYDMLREERVERPLIETGGLFGRWLWAFRCKRMLSH